MGLDPADRLRPPLRPGAITRAVAVLAAIVLVVSACGASEPSSAVLDDASTPPPATSGAPGVTPTLEPASGTPPSTAPSKPPASQGTADRPPPKPGNVTFRKVGTKPGPKEGTFTETYRITWTSPKGVADSFLAYGMQDCLRYAKRYDGKPCVVKGMPIDPDSLTLLGVAPGGQRSMEVSWDVGEVSVPTYWTILLRAANAAGNSIFTIVKSYDVCWGCVY